MSDRMLWTTKEGATLCMYDMDESHLRNSLAMIKRRIASADDFYDAVYTKQLEKVAVDLEHVLLSKEMLRGFV